jgi:hypothetical protein
MSLDRRIYLATAVAALLIGGAVVMAAPHDRFEGVMTIHVGTGASERLGPASGIALRGDAAQPPGVVVPVEGGTGVRAPAQWPPAAATGGTPETVRVAARESARL